MKRTEYHAFIEGAKFVIELFSDQHLDGNTIALRAKERASELYPDYEPFPPPSRGNV